MKNTKRIRVFAIMTALLTLVMSLVVFAEDKNLSGKELSFGERLEYALQGTVTGLLMVFAVLALLWGILTLSRVVFYDIPKKRKAAEENTAETVTEAAETPAPVEEITEPAYAEDDGELAAVITAAVAAMIESGEYGEEFAGGFRVVSFKRRAVGAWNKK